MQNIVTMLEKVFPDKKAFSQNENGDFRINTDNLGMDQLIMLSSMKDVLKDMKIRRSGAGLVVIITPLIQDGSRFGRLIGSKVNPMSKN